MSDRPPPLPSLPPAGEERRRKLATRTLLSLAVGGLFVWFFRRAGVEVIPDADAFSHMRWWTVFAYFGLYTVVHYFRAARWDYLLRPVARIPSRRIIALSFVGFLAILLLPFRMGELVRPMLVRRRGVLSGSAATGTIIAERVIDGLFVALVLAGALLFVPHRELRGVHLGAFPIERLPALGYFMVFVFGSALVTLAVFLWKRAWAERMTLRVVGFVSEKLARRLSGIVGGMADGLRSLPDPKLMGPFIAYTAVYWCANALTMCLLGWGCGLDMTPGQGFAVMGVLAIGILLPAAPGLFGAFQFAVFAALLLYFPEAIVRKQGAAYVFLMYALQTLFHLVAGLGGALLERVSPAQAMATSDESALDSTAPLAEKLP